MREAGKRVLGMRHFDVQIMGGQALHEGNVAEMRTGEGKTLVATLPVYLNALTGKGVHLVTVNDYLAKRDAEWMGPLYEALGLTVGIIQHDLDHNARKEAYNSDITYVTNNEVGFDYLRDNMAWALDQMVQRHLNFAIVDEVDSILIDEARTPLIISGQGHDATELYGQFAKIIPRLVKDEDFTVDQKSHAAPITEKGVAKVEKMLGVSNLYDQRNLELTHQLNAALKAWNLFHKDQQYIVKDGEIIIVDEFTGRLMYGRRYSEGIHQAIEAKEGLDVRSEDQTLATITFQNYFRLYDKLAGMTGTAKTEEREFREIYGLNVVVLPTNMPVRRKDMADIVYRTENAKFGAVIDDIIEEHRKDRPVLVGTRSIEKSERLAMMLRRKGVECNVLNAKYHEQEAQIIKDAGIPGKVTIATNMAGRGVDIKLGEGVPDAGGLHIIGTERHESRRIDNQLRGRAGRQGDPGTTRFYIALEDELMRLFGQERLQKMMDFVKFTDETPIEAGILSRSIENAQSKVENHNYEIRKQVLEYDDVMNKQREVIYGERRRVLEGQPLRDFFVDTLRNKVGVRRRHRRARRKASVGVGSVGDARRAGAAVPDQGARQRRGPREARPRGHEGAAVQPRARGVRGKRSRGHARDHADGRVAVHHAADHRQALGGSLVRDGRAQDRHRFARLRAERPARRVRKRSVRDLRGPQEQHRRRSDQSGVRGAHRSGAARGVPGLRARTARWPPLRRTPTGSRTRTARRPTARRRSSRSRRARSRRSPRSRASTPRWRNACSGPRRSTKRRRSTPTAATTADRRSRRPRRPTRSAATSCARAAAARSTNAATGRPPERDHPAAAREARARAAQAPRARCAPARRVLHGGVRRHAHRYAGFVLAACGSGRARAASRLRRASRRAPASRR